MRGGRGEEHLRTRRILDEDEFHRQSERDRCPWVLFQVAHLERELRRIGPMVVALEEGYVRATRRGGRYPGIREVSEAAHVLGPEHRANNDVPRRAGDRLGNQ